MPKQYTFPYLFDELKNISITNLIKWKYLEKNTFKSGTITWSNRYNEVTGRITIHVTFTDKEQSVTLDYKTDDEVYDVKINLVSVHSNLGKGKVWYFICPYTRKRCRILHLIQGKFIHRSALPSGMYSKQTHSKKWRNIEKVYGTYFDNDKHYSELYSKHFKKYYKGRPTKRYLKLMRKISDAERHSYSDIERLFLI